MRLTRTAVDRYGPLAGCEPPCDDGLTIVAGPNESGKTLFLEGLLQLLDPGVVDHMDPGTRVASEPTGRVVLDDGAERHELGDGTTLGDVSRIDPSHLHSLFVIRDGDLALPETSDYYTSLVEHLGDVHTTELAAIRDGLVEEGRLTPTALNLSDQKPTNTKTAKAAVDGLAADVTAYVDDATSHGIDDLARQRRSLLAERRAVAADLETQRTASELAAIADAAENLETYRRATERLRSAGKDRETLQRLRALDGDAGHARERIEEIDDALDRKRTALDRHRKALDRTRDRHGELAQREDAVARVKTALEGYRDRTRRSTAGDDLLAARLTHRRRATAAGLVGAGLAAAAGALVGRSGVDLPFVLAGAVGVAAFAVAAVAWWSHRRLANRAAAADERERDVLETARDAGFDVGSVEEVPVRIRAYRDELDGVADRIRELNAQVEQTAEQVAELEADRRAAVDERDRLREEVRTTLAEAGVDSIEAYERRLEDLEELETRRSNATTVLSRELGEPDATEPEAKIERWESALAERRAAVDDDGVDAAQYDEAELDRLEARLADVDADFDEVESKLERHEATLDEFERRVGDLSLPPFVETTPSLRARTLDGLRDLVTELRDVSATIDENAEISRKAIGIVDEIRDAEERKAATLFSPDGPASETFAHLTDGRYAAVEYDPDAGTLAVRRSDGGRLAVSQLSQGTRDQLYFAARLSLAEQVLGGRSGFLLLDDPFLAADRTRLRNGFETLQDLVADGWQIFYLTAKPEVHDTMADEFGCAVHEMEPLGF